MQVLVFSEFATAAEKLEQSISGQMILQGIAKSRRDFLQIPRATFWCQIWDSKFDPS
jgi:hypothetical protein